MTYDLPRYRETEEEKEAAARRRRQAEMHPDCKIVWPCANGQGQTGVVEA